MKITLQGKSNLPPDNVNLEWRSKPIKLTFIFFSRATNAISEKHISTKLRQAVLSIPLKTCTTWKVSKYGVISGPYFPVFGVDTGKYGPKISSYLDTFHARYGISFPSKNTLNYAKIMNSKSSPILVFSRKLSMDKL